MGLESSISQFRYFVQITLNNERLEYLDMILRHNISEDVIFLYCYYRRLGLCRTEVYQILTTQSRNCSNDHSKSTKQALALWFIWD